MSVALLKDPASLFRVLSVSLVVRKVNCAFQVYVQVNQFVDGWESQPTSFRAIVPDVSDLPLGRAGC